MNNRYIFRIVLKPLFKTIEEAIKDLAEILNKIKFIVNPILSRFGYRLLGIRVHPDANPNLVDLDIYIEKVKSPQFAIIALAIIAAIAFLLHGLGFAFEGWSLIKQRTGEEVEREKASELMQRVVKDVESGKIPASEGSKIIQSISRVIAPTPVQIPEKEELKKESIPNILSQISNIITLVIVAYVLISFVFPIIRGVINVISRRFA